MKPHYRILTDDYLAYLRGMVPSEGPVIRKNKRVYIAPNAYIDHVNGYFIYAFNASIGLLYDHTATELHRRLVTQNPLNVSYAHHCYKPDPDGALYKELVAPYEQAASDCYNILDNYRYFLAWSETVAIGKNEITMYGNNLLIMVTRNTQSAVFLPLREMLMEVVIHAKALQVEYCCTHESFIMTIVTQADVELKWVVSEDAGWFMSYVNQLNRQNKQPKNTSGTFIDSLKRKHRRDYYGAL